MLIDSSPTRLIFYGLPFDEQPIARRPFGRALQCQTSTALGAPEYRRGLRYAGLELGFHAGFHVDLGDFEDHPRVSRSTHDGKAEYRGVAASAETATALVNVRNVECVGTTISPCVARDGLLPFVVRLKKASGKLSATRWT